MIELPSPFIFSPNKEQFQENSKLLTQFINEKIQIEFKVFSKGTQQTYIDINNDLQIVALRFSLSYLKTNKITIIINILNIDEKKHQLIVRIVKINGLQNTSLYFNFLIGRFKSTKHNSLFLYKLKELFPNNFLKIKKIMNLQIPQNSYPISLNTFIVPVTNEDTIVNMLCNLFSNFLNLKKPFKTTMHEFYYNINYTTYSLSKWFYLNRRPNDLIIGKIFVNKEIKYSSVLKFQFEYVIEFGNKRTFVFGSLKGGDGLFPLKDIQYWSEVKHVEICKSWYNL